MSEPVNQAKLVIENPSNSIITAEGFNAAFSGENFDKFLSLPKIAGRHNATDVSKLFYEKHSKAIMLKPIIELDSMVDGIGYATEDGSPAAKWEVKSLAGQPQLNLIHQYNVVSKQWVVKKTGDDKLYANEGFMIYWQKMLTPTGSSPILTISIESGTDYYIKITIMPRQKILLERKIGTDEQKLETTLPESYFETESFNRMKVLTCMFIDEYIIIGMNGLDQTIGFKCQKYTTVEDVNKKLIIQSNPGGDLRVKGDGACLLGLKILKYETIGSFATPIQYPGYKMVTSPEFEFTKSTKPTFEEESPVKMTATVWAGDNKTGSENVGGTGKEGIERCGTYACIFFSSLGWVSPLLYSFRIYQAPRMATQTTAALQLDTDIRSYREETSGDKDGNFMGSSIRAEVVCKVTDNKLTHSRLFRSKAPQVKHYLKLRGKETEVLRALNTLDVKEIGRPSWNRFDLELISQDVTKRLRTMPILVSENYDGRGWKHTDLMKEIGRGAGITIHCAPTTDDKTVPASYHYLQASGDKEKPNWQFNRGMMRWDAMQRVREFSGWLLAPYYDFSDSDFNGELYYRPKPTADDSEKYAFNADSDIVSNVRYRSVDMYRTRIMIFGIAAADSSEVLAGDYDNEAWRYKKGDILAGVGMHPKLEKELGRSEPLVWADPTFSDWKAIGVALLRLYNYYTATHVSPVFQINNFEDYQDLHSYDLIKWTDDTKDYQGEKLIDEKFLLTSLSVSADKFTSIATVNSMATEKAMIHGILAVDKREREGGMRDYHDIIKGMEAVTKGDYQRMLTEAPAAMRVFAYNDETVNDWGQKL